ncbi:hypothetical protein BRADI_3g07533v3 [Brachypodium distachyon]|uniref:Uncharacterized protein n=1 Tax=Brachypodium distachyon TaxID=15368 RepID=A0A2K2CVS5_BRADI|nr:hypothetical protein BRADI_3g07533v3 [Brachypodium distachyon]
MVILQEQQSWDLQWFLSTLNGIQKIQDMYCVNNTRYLYLPNATYPPFQKGWKRRKYTLSPLINTHKQTRIT